VVSEVSQGRGAYRVDDDENDMAAFYRREFTVYNPPRSVGVSCDGRGEVVALMLEQDALAAGDVELAEEIVAIAGLARAKYRMELRLHCLNWLVAEGGNPERMDVFYRRVQKLPTPEEYREMEHEFAKRYLA